MLIKIDPLFETYRIVVFPSFNIFPTFYTVTWGLGKVFLNLNKEEAAIITLHIIVHVKYI